MRGSLANGTYPALTAPYPPHARSSAPYDCGVNVGLDPDQPLVLDGRYVRLESMAADHLPGLVACGLDPRIWTWMPFTVSDEAGMRTLVQAAIDARAAGSEFPFVTIDRASGQVVGSSRFLALAPAQRRLEIGWTWITPSAQRSAVNTEAKLLMLRFAFEELDCLRVEFKTDARNAAFTSSPAGHRCDLRGRLPQAHAGAGRASP